jgi:hypothetical protein
VWIYSELLFMDYSEFRKGKKLEEILSFQEVRTALRDHPKYGFLLDDEMFVNFKTILAELSSRAADSIKKEDKNANVVFTTAHGSKGKEFSEVIVAEDFFAPNDEGQIPDEECNLAYVAVSRAKERVHFTQPEVGEHPLHALFVEKRGEIEAKLQQPYLYRFPGGEEMTISRIGPLYQHVLRHPTDGTDGVFALDRPASAAQAGIDESGTLRCLRWYDPSIRKYAYIDPFGNDLPHSEIGELQMACNFMYAAGEGSNPSVWNKKKLKNEAPSPGSIPF